MFDARPKAKTCGSGKSFIIGRAGWGKETSPKEMGENRADNNYPLALLLLSVLLGAAVELQVSQGIGRGTFK